MSERCDEFHPVAGISPMRCRLSKGHESPLREIGGLSQVPFHKAQITISGAIVTITWESKP